MVLRFSGWLFVVVIAGSVCLPGLMVGLLVRYSGFWFDFLVVW